MKIVISGDVSDVSSFLLELRKLLRIGDQENYISLASVGEIEREEGEGK